MPWAGTPSTRVLRAPPKQALDVSRDGASITFWSNLFQCLINPIVKHLFLTFNLNLFPFTAIPPCPVTAGCKEPFFVSLVAPLRYWNGLQGSLGSFFFSRLPSPSSVSLCSCAGITKAELCVTLSLLQQVGHCKGEILLLITYRKRMER